MTGTPFLLLPLRTTPHILEREPVSRRKVGGSEKHTGPKQMATLSLQTQKRAFGTHVYLLPTLLRIGGKKEKREGGEGERGTEVARKECPASQKLNSLPKSGTGEEVVAPAPPSPVPGAR